MLGKPLLFKDFMAATAEPTPGRISLSALFIKLSSALILASTPSLINANCTEVRFAEPVSIITIF